MLEENKILITGGTGRLGKACKKIFGDAIYPTKKDMDITNPEMIKSFLAETKPKYIIHLAALASIPACEEDKSLAWRVNVESTKNLVELAKKAGVEKFLYLQSACIFSGEDAPYDENSIANPKHYYGFTKIIAEEIIKSYNDDNFKTLIARTNFTTMPWEYEKAFTDRFGTYLFAQGVAKGMKDFLKDDKANQIIHICGERKISMYEYATLGGSKVGKLTMGEYSGICLTRDMSLVTKKWYTYKIEDSDFNDNKKNMGKEINKKNNPFVTGYNLLLNDPKELFKKIATQLQIQYNKIIVKLFYSRSKKVINEGERFDPLLTTGYIDNSHLPRYDFAKNHISKNDTVLDIASGTGYGTEILSKSCSKIYGVDISKDAIEYAKRTRKGNNIEFINNDLYKNNINTDIVVSFETIEHIPNKKIEETIEKLINYANKIIIGSYPYKEKDNSNPYHFQYNLDENNLNIFKVKYNVSIYYQDINGKIFDNNLNTKKIQNLIFVIKK